MYTLAALSRLSFKIVNEIGGKSGGGMRERVEGMVDLQKYIMYRCETLNQLRKNVIGCVWHFLKFKICLYIPSLPINVLDSAVVDFRSWNLVTTVVVLLINRVNKRGSTFVWGVDVDIVVLSHSSCHERIWYPSLCRMQDEDDS